MKLKFASIFVLAALLLGMTAPAYAQKSLSPEEKYKGWEVNGGISAIPYFNLLIVYLFSSLGHPSDPVAEPAPKGDGFDLPLGIDLNARYNFNRWLSVGVTSNTQYYSDPKYKTVNKGEANEETYYCGMHKLFCFSLMPDVRITYYKARRFSVYSQAALGIIYYGTDKYCNNSLGLIYPWVSKSVNSGDESGGDSSSSSSSSSLDLQLPFQTAPLGFTFGSKWYGYIQAEYGLMNLGASAGVGYRF